MAKQKLGGLIVIACAMPLLAISDTQWKPKLLKPADELRWIATVKNHRTGDGSTVKDVLSYAEMKRPRQFKVAEIGIGYNGATGEADSVFISYWIGNKRKRDESFVDLGYDMNNDGSRPRVVVLKDRPMLAALEQGKAAFLAAIDTAYADHCVDAESRKPIC